MIDKEKECKHCGWHKRWRYRRGKGHDCMICNQRRTKDRRKERRKYDSEYARRENNRKRMEAKRRQVRVNYNKLLEFGLEYAEKYKADKEKGIVSDYRNYMPLIEGKALEKEKSRKKYDKNKEKIKARTKEYSSNHYLQIPRRFSRVIKITRNKEGPWSCEKCSYVSDKYWVFDVDHVIPVRDGGTDDLSNLQILCGICHKEKSFFESSSRGKRYQIVEQIERIIALSI